jgi:hypothetical protein
MTVGGHLDPRWKYTYEIKARDLRLPKARPSHERSNAVSDITNEKTEDEIFSYEISDESLEIAAFAGNAGAYTQFAYCTQFGCPGYPG